MLGKKIQSENIPQSEHFDKFGTIIKVCKASGVNFNLMCLANVDMNIKESSESRDLSKSGTFKDRTYFLLEFF